MDDEVTAAPTLAGAAADRTSSLLSLLRRHGANALDEPSGLPGWSRLTIACHLRYGARALLRMTEDALAGTATSYYPDGREQQRPGTLAPAAGESALDVLDDWESAARTLDRLWDGLAGADWAAPVVEPPDNPDLGTVPLARLALARLTEVDVHGTDLGIGAPDWSATLVEVGLPTRLGWLATRRTNHRDFERSLVGSWSLRGSDGFRWLVAVDGEGVVESRPQVSASELTTSVISASSRDLYALLLGRRPTGALQVDGDREFAHAFSRAFPGP